MFSVSSTGIQRDSNDADGGTEAAEMCIRGCVDAGDKPLRNAGKLVSEIVRDVFTHDSLLNASSSTRRIVESLIWPVVARVSFRTPWFDDKSYRRLIKSAQDTAIRVLGFDQPGSLSQKYVKYWCDKFLHNAMKNREPFPASDQFGTLPLFSGFLRLFVQRAIARRDVGFIYSLQKGSRRLWPALDKKCERDALSKHRDRLTRASPITPTSVLHTIRTVAAKYSPASVKMGSKFMPSGSSCIQATVDDGGALSLFDNFVAPLTGDLRDLTARLNTWRQKTFECAVNTTAQQTYSELASVSVVAIPEPGKFRIITKGNGFLYTALQPLQGLLLDSWKRCKASTMRDENLLPRVQNMLDQKPDGSLFWCSVDYEAATDLLHRDATLAAVGAIRRLPLGELALLSFVGGVAEYPKALDGITCKFGEGQLMGHPLSFPFLCMINLSVYLQTRFEVTGRPPCDSLDDDEVLVNGDDMLFRCDQGFFEVFRRISKSVGFKFSDGKNYLSEDCAVINSQMYIQKGQTVKRLGYLNLKLVCRHNIKSGDSQSLPTEIGAQLTKMVNSCPWTACTVPTAFSHWNKDIKVHGFRPNWCLPVVLGGFGYTSFNGVFRVTREQRIVAAQFVNDTSLALYRKTGAAAKIKSRFLGAIGSYRWLTTAGPLASHETEESDEWEARLSYAARAVMGSKAVVSVPARIRRDYRLKAMSLDNLQKYVNARFVRYHGAVCPPLLPLVLRNPNIFHAMTHWFWLNEDQLEREDVIRHGRGLVF